MSIVVPSTQLSQGLADWLDARGALTIHLYKNDYFPALTSVLGDFTQSTFTGSSPVALTGRVINYLAGLATAAWDDVTWSDSSGIENVYGYYVTDGGGDYVWGERDPAAPFNIAPGRSYTVSPRFSSDNIP